MTYLQPLLAIFLLISLLCLVALRRASGRRRHWLDFAGLAGLFLVSWPPVAWLAAATLEHRYAAAPLLPADADAIVVLGGNSYPANPSQPESEPGFSTYLRAAHGAWLYHHWKAVPVIVSGGIPGTSPDVTLAGLMQHELIERGVPESAITLEGRSSSTFENAVDSAALLRAKGIHRIVLVTEGFHMLRAELCFRKQGLDVVPAPCALHTMESPFALLRLPGFAGLRTNEECLHEWFGLAWYKVTGRI